MRTRLAVLAALILAAGVLGSPAQAAGSKKVDFNIAAPLADGASAVGAGNTNAGTTKAAKRACPNPGELDGVFYKFIDMKGEYTKLKAYGPKPLFTQNTPVGVMMDYDIDLYAFDAKCNRIETKNGATSGANGGGIEVLPTKKPVRYAVVVYWLGPYPNLKVTLEYS